MNRAASFSKSILPSCMALVMVMGCRQESKPAVVLEASKPRPLTELLDISLSEPARKSLDAFSQMDLEGFTAEFADDINYTWSNGDSLRGKEAVKEYYAGRFKIIESISFTDHLFLPIQINESPTKSVAPGRWLLQWAYTHIRYKNGKKVDLWIHNVNHYNADGKIDFLGQYMDRYPILEATKGMKTK